jgi:DnaJ-class molecular chaperone
MPVTCPACDGDGGGESTPTGYNPMTTHWINCVVCDGKGEIEINIEPRTLEDMDEEAAL